MAKKTCKPKYYKILTHPNVDLIIKLLTEGFSAKYVSDQLKQMWPHDKRKHLALPTILDFRKNHLRIDQRVIEEINLSQQLRVEAQKLTPEEREKAKINNALDKVPSYQEKIKEAIGMHVDIKQQLANLHMIMSARIEDIYNRLAEGRATGNDERHLQNYFQTYINLIEKWAKYIDQVADFKVETNINVTLIENQLSLTREVVFEVMKEMDPALAIKFMDKLNKRMTEFSYRADKVPTLKELHCNVSELTKKISDAIEIKEISKELKSESLPGNNEENNGK